MSICAAAMLILSVSPAQAAPEAATTGDRWHDNLDTRWQAHRLAQASGNAGYAASRDINGRAADNVWTDGLGSAIWGVFAHSNSGFMATKDAGGKEYLIAGGEDNVVSTSSTRRYLREYLPYIDVDDVRLAIFAGCYTALKSDILGDLDQAASELGVDSVVTFPGLVYSPVSQPGTAMNQTNYSGGYFWSRASYYLASKVTVAQSLKRAHSDLVNKEGRGDGWGRYQVHGSVGQPGRVRITPAASGEPYTSYPSGSSGVARYSSLDDLTVTQTSSTSGPQGPLELVTTAEGVDYRQYPDGGLFDLTAPTASEGEVSYSHVAARGLAVDFIERYVPTASTWSLAGEEITHVADDVLSRFTWRPVIDGVRGPQQAMVEIDRRTGAVTYFLHAHGEANNIAITITKEEAIDAARSVTGPEGRVVEAVASVWDTARWEVTIDRGPRAESIGTTPDFRTVTVDAATAEVLAISGT